MTKPSWDVLSPHQQTVAREFLAERDAERLHVVIYLSGAHAYGFPSPDSDLDLKCVHVAPTGDLVGLEPREGGSERTEVIEDVELDYSSNELGLALRGAIKGNGNFLERFLGELALGGDADMRARARTIVQPLLSRRVAHHYRGFAKSQLRAFDDSPTAKRALYVIRTAATGRCLLARGELVTDVNRMPELVPDGIDELLAIKRTGEKSPLPPDVAASWRAKLVGTIEGIEAGYPGSVLPDEPPAEALAAADAWLREIRHAHW
jgi:uncharacterized protein